MGRRAVLLLLLATLLTAMTASFATTAAAQVCPPDTTLGTNGVTGEVGCVAPSITGICRRARSRSCNSGCPPASVSGRSSTVAGKNRRRLRSPRRLARTAATRRSATITRVGASRRRTKRVSSCHGRVVREGRDFRTSAPFYAPWSPEFGPKISAPLPHRRRSKKVGHL